VTYLWINAYKHFLKDVFQSKELTDIATMEIGLKPLQNEEFVNCEREELAIPITRNSI